MTELTSSALIRTADRSDIDGILAVQRLADRATDEKFRSSTAAAIDDPLRCFVVATVSEEIIGWATTHQFLEDDGPAPAGQYLMGITVAPAHRRTGVGSALTAARLHWAEQHTSDAYYFTNAGNTASIALHESWNFREIARGAEFRGVGFTNGVGVLFAAELVRAPTA